MNKTLKGIIAGCGVLAVLGGGLAALKLTENPGEDSTEDSHEHMPLLWEYENADAVSRVEIQRADGSKIAANRKWETITDTDYSTGEQTEKQSAAFILEGYEDLPQNAANLRVLASRANSVTASAVVEENPADLAKYGLDKPVTVTITTDSSGDITFLLGDKVPGGGYNYLQMKDNAAVYTIEEFEAEPFRSEINDLLGTEVNPKLEEDNTVIVDSVRVSRKDLDKDIYLTYDKFSAENSRSGTSAVHVMQEPIYCLLNVEKSSKITFGIYGLTATEVVYPHPTEAQIKECGFDDPFATVTVNTDDGKTRIFRLGGTYEKTDKDADGKETTQKYYYGMLDSVNCIYGFAPDANEFDNVKAEDITAKIVVDDYVWDIGSLVYKAGSLTLDFKGKGNDQDDFILRLNGEETDAERYRLLYTYLLKTAAEDLVLDDVTLSGEPMVSVELERQDGQRGTTKIEFYDAGGLKAYIVINGTVRYRCRKSYVTTLIHNMEIYGDTDQQFTMTW